MLPLHPYLPFPADMQPIPLVHGLELHPLTVKKYFQQVHKIFLKDL